jgi:hypothetical protein
MLSFKCYFIESTTSDIRPATSDDYDLVSKLEKENYPDDPWIGSLEEFENVLLSFYWRTTCKGNVTILFKNP